MLEYRGYYGDVELDVDAGILHGRLLGIRAVVTFESDSIEGIKREFQTSVDSYLAMCEADGVEPEKPFSGKFNVRVEPELHRALVAAARVLGLSLNAFIERTLGEAVGVKVPDRVIRAGAEKPPVERRSIGKSKATGKTKALK